MYSLISKSRKSLCTITDNQLIAEILMGDKHKHKRHAERFLKTFQNCTSQLKIYFFKRYMHLFQHFKWFSTFK